MNPLPNHCIECDTPTMDTLCDKCKEKDMGIELNEKEAKFFRITGEREKSIDHLDKAMQELQLHAEEMWCEGCGEIHPICYCDMAPDDGDPLSNCCDAPFTYPGWPDSDMCSKCYEHADIGEDDG